MRPDARPRAPGRYCPTHYRYAPADLARAQDLNAETLYVVGGLYGNEQALDAILQLAEREPGGATLVFNGDFNWFNTDPAGFARINARVLRHHALRGNVETELAHDDAAAGCGCAYPESVPDGDVARSNQIEDRLRATARGFPQLRSQLAALPMRAVARVGSLRVGIVHGDAEALAGWGFARTALDDPRRRARLEGCFAEAGVRVYASSHTCHPVCRTLETGGGICAVINNGAAGMPNFSGTQFGLITRIALRSSALALYGATIDGVHVEAIPVAYPQAAWLNAFLGNWPAGTPAHTSYWNRLLNGPAAETPAAAAPGAARHAPEALTSGA